MKTREDDSAAYIAELTKRKDRLLREKSWWSACTNDDHGKKVIHFLNGALDTTCRLIDDLRSGSVRIIPQPSIPAKTE